MKRALTLFLGNGYSCLCSAGVTIALIRKKKMLFKRPAWAAGLRHHVADRASPGQQISIQTPVFIKNRKIMEITLKTSECNSLL